MFKFVGPDFINCNGTEDITLGDLKVNCDEESDDPSEGWKPLQDNIILLDEEGNNERTLVYMNEALAAAYSEETAEQGIVWTKGWYDADDVDNLEYEKKYDTEPLDFGLGVQVNVNSGNENAGFVFSGAVKSGAPTISDVCLFMSIVNCTPVNKTIGDFKVNCDEESDDPSEGWKPLQDNIILLDEEGNNERTLVYMNEVLATAYSEETADQGIVWTKGWYDADDVDNLEYEKKYDTEPVPAGEGVQVNVNSGNEDVTVQVDSAL